MIILATLALTVLADGYRLYDQPPSRIDNNMIQMMCEQNGVNYTLIEYAGVEFSQCMEVNVQVKEIENEINDAYMNHTYSAFNRVFKKYCPKVPELKACTNKLVSAVAPCLGDDHQDFITLSSNLSDRLLDYFCERDGYIITKFIMEGGPECFDDKFYDIMSCAERLRYLLMYTSQTMTVSKAQNVYDEMMQCILRRLETCHNLTTAKIFTEVSEIIHRTISQGVLESTKNVTKAKNDRISFDDKTSTNTTQYSGSSQIVPYRNESFVHYVPSTTSTTKRLRDGPTNTTKPEWHRQRPTAERKWYNGTNPTDRQKYNLTTTTERVWNNVSDTSLGEKDSGVAVKFHCDNSQGQFGHNGAEHNTTEDGKNIGLKTTRSFFKASGSVAVVFNADIFV